MSAYLPIALWASPSMSMEHTNLRRVPDHQPAIRRTAALVAAGKAMRCRWLLPIGTGAAGHELVKVSKSAFSVRLRSEVVCHSIQWE